MSPIRHPDPSPVRSAGGAPSAHGTTLTDVRIDSDSDAGVDIVTSTRVGLRAVPPAMQGRTRWTSSRILAREIERLPAGHKIASEQQLMARFGVSRSAVRHAIASSSRAISSVGSRARARTCIAGSTTRSRTPRRRRCTGSSRRAAGATPHVRRRPRHMYPAPEHHQPGCSTSRPARRSRSSSVSPHRPTRPRCISRSTCARTPPSISM